MIIQNADEIPHAVFLPLGVGTSESLGTQTILPGYAVGWHNSFTGFATVSTSGGIAGAIWSFLPSENCLSAPSTAITVTYTHKTSANVVQNSLSTYAD